MNVLFIMSVQVVHAKCLLLKRGAQAPYSYEYDSHVEGT